MLKLTIYREMKPIERLMYASKFKFTDAGIKSRIRDKVRSLRKKYRDESVDTLEAKVVKPKKKRRKKR